MEKWKKKNLKLLMMTNDIVARVIVRDRLLYIDMKRPEFYKQIYDFIHKKEDLEKGIYLFYKDLTYMKKE